MGAGDGVPVGSGFGEAGVHDESSPVGEGPRRGEPEGQRPGFRLISVGASANDRPCLM